MSATTVTAQPETASSFVQRRIDITFRLGSGTFGNTNSDTVTVTGLRCSASITKAGGVSQGALDLRVYGMTSSVANQLQVIGGAPVAVQAGHSVTVLAGSTAGGMAIAYQGTIASAMTDYSNAPGVFLHVIGIAALDAAVMPIPPTSYNGSFDVAAIMASLAAQMNLVFENNGVQVLLSTPYFWGSPYQQAESVAAAAGIEWVVDNGTLAIWPKGGSRGGAAPLISPQTGMRGYPVVTPIGVELTTLYNPALTFGATVQVQSSLTNACGTWQIASMAHTLESQTPNGAWFSRLKCVPVGFV